MPLFFSFHGLNGAAAAAEATHLQHVRDVKKIRRADCRRLSACDCVEQTFSVDRLGKNFRVRDLQPLFRGGVGGRKSVCSPGKISLNAPPKARPSNPSASSWVMSNAHRAWRRPQSSAAAGCPPNRTRARCNLSPFAPVARRSLGVAVHDEHLHYGEGAVEGEGKRLNSFVGSARWACSLSL